MRRWLWVLNFFVASLSQALDLYYSETYFNPERVGESRWTKVDASKASSTLDLGTLSKSSNSNSTIVFEVKVSNTSSQTGNITLSPPPDGFKYQSYPNTWVAAGKDLVITYELVMSSLLGVKNFNLTAQGPDNSTAKLNFKYVIKE